MSLHTMRSTKRPAFKLLFRWNMFSLLPLLRSSDRREPPLRLRAAPYSLLPLLLVWPSQPAPAQTLSVPKPSEAPLELSQLQPDRSQNNGSTTGPNTISCDQTTVITANTICQNEQTIPSLWWAKQQFGGNLLTNWLAYPPEGTTAGRIDLVVDRPTWNSIDYLERYEFVNNFGTVARDYGYNVRVFNYQKELLATYTCNFDSDPKLCRIDNLETRDQAAVRGSK